MRLHGQEDRIELAALTHIIHDDELIDRLLAAIGRLQDEPTVAERNELVVPFHDSNLGVGLSQTCGEQSSNGTAADNTYFHDFRNFVVYMMLPVYVSALGSTNS